MPVEERIRRAEEIYARRNRTNGVRVSTNSVNTRKEYKLFKKMIIKIVICLLIYLAFYFIKNSNYIFSENIIEQTKNFLSYDINLEEVYVNVENYYNKNIKPLFLINNNTLVNEQTNEIIENVNQVSQLEENNTINENESKITNTVTKTEEGAVLSENENLQSEQIDIEKPSELSQMEIDANDIKNNYSLIVPLDGIVSSRFGPRTPTDIVSANHAGIDIAANEGTQFIAAMEGMVTYVSSEGGYGNHLWVQKDDVATIYAHCSNIFVNEGDYISQGQIIGEVGQTGNATGPHLHFEIRKSDRLVNPELLLKF